MEAAAIRPLRTPGLVEVMRRAQLEAWEATPVRPTLSEAWQATPARLTLSEALRVTLVPRPFWHRNRWQR